MRMKWLLMRHSPLVIWPVLDPNMWRWGLSMLANCTEKAYAINKSRMVPIAEYSRDCLDELRAETGIAYEGRSLGTTQLFRTQAQLDGAAKDIAVLKESGVPFEVLDRAGIARVEPALANVTDILAGALRLPIVAITSGRPSVAAGQPTAVRSRGGAAARAVRAGMPAAAATLPAVAARAATAAPAARARPEASAPTAATADWRAHSAPAAARVVRVAPAANPPRETAHSEATVATAARPSATSVARVASAAPAVRAAAQVARAATAAMGISAPSRAVSVPPAAAAARAVAMQSAATAAAAVTAVRLYWPAATAATAATAAGAITALPKAPTASSAAVAPGRAEAAPAVLAVQAAKRADRANDTRNGLPHRREAVSRVRPVDCLGRPLAAHAGAGTRYLCVLAVGVHVGNRCVHGVPAAAQAQN